MWNEPSEEELAQLPRLYSTEGIPIEEKIIYLHFFIAGSDWYVAEYDPSERVFFGFVVLNNDYRMAEWGYFSLDELIHLKIGPLEVDRDLYWEPKKFRETEAFRKAWFRC
jgi:hypothetical protein